MIPAGEPDRETPPTDADGPGEPEPPGDTVPAPTGPDAIRINIANGGRDVTVEEEQPLAPPRGNGQAADPDDPLAIPAFLRRTP